MTAATVTLVAAAVGSYAREGTRAYDVYLDDKGIGEVRRYRERYPHKSLGGNVSLFRSRWAWGASGVRRSFDTRAEAIKALIEEASRV